MKVIVFLLCMLLLPFVIATSQSVDDMIKEELNDIKTACVEIYAECANRTENTTRSHELCQESIRTCDVTLRMYEECLAADNDAAKHTIICKYTDELIDIFPDSAFLYTIKLSCVFNDLLDNMPFKEELDIIE